MIKRLYRRLPGPQAVKVLLAALVILMALVVLGYIFEQAGGLLDTGGVIQ